jgi:hypothetical protein
MAQHRLRPLFERVRREARRPIRRGSHLANRRCQARVKLSAMDEYAESKMIGSFGKR